MKRIIAASAVSIGLFLMGGGSAEAAQCSVSTTPVTFGTYDVFVPTPLDSVGSVVYRCNGGAPTIAITMSAGQGAGFSPRKLFSASEWMGYNVFRDPSRTVVWGDGTGGTSFYVTASIPNNIDVSVPAYGRVDAGQDVRAGAYADHISVTINF